MSSTDADHGASQKSNVKLRRPAELSGAQRRYLRAQAHQLKPLVIIGKSGITDGVIEAVNEALDRHELIKVSTPPDGAKLRNEMGQTLAEQTGSHVAQTIGRIVVLFRQKAKESAFKLPQKNG